MKAIILSITICLFGFLFFNFSSNNTIPKLDVEENYAPTIFPNDTTQLWIGEGNLESDTI